MNLVNLLTAISSLIFCGLGGFGLLLCWLAVTEFNTDSTRYMYPKVALFAVACVYSIYYGVKQWLNRGVQK